MAKVCYNRAVGCRNTRLTPVHHRRVTMTAHVDNVPCICGKPECQIPYGLCHCGCGKYAPIASRNLAKRGHKKGFPKCYLWGHNTLVLHEINRPDTSCICGVADCPIPAGLCHCGCGGKTQVTKKRDYKAKLVAGEVRKYIRGHQCIETKTIEDAKPFKIDGVYCRLIQLGESIYTIVYDSDYKNFAKWNWFPKWNQFTRSYYATRVTHRTKGEEVRTIWLHRELLGLYSDDILEGDHINRVTLDNRRSNLRVATSQQNACNHGKPRNNTSGYKGVCYCAWKRTNKWRSIIGVNNKVIHLGYFEDAESAYDAYCVAAKKYHGEFARLA